MGLRKGEWGMGSWEWGAGKRYYFNFPLPIPHSPLPNLHFFPPDIWESIEAEPPP